MEPDELLPLLAANLASLNEVVAELAQARAITEDQQEWADVVCRSLREHSWSLGFEFQGQRGLAPRVAVPCEDIVPLHRTEVVRETGGRL